jgi:hypothetical protein
MRQKLIPVSSGLLEGAVMRSKLSHTHCWVIAAEHALLRAVALAAGAMLIIVSLLLDATILMLPAGLALGLAGMGVIVWGLTGDVLED